MHKMKMITACSRRRPIRYRSKSQEQEGTLLARLAAAAAAPALVFTAHRMPVKLNRNSDGLCHAREAGRARAVPKEDAFELARCRARQFLRLEGVEDAPPTLEPEAAPS